VRFCLVPHQVLPEWQALVAESRLHQQHLGPHSCKQSTLTTPMVPITHQELPTLPIHFLLKRRIAGVILQAFVKS